ncbi:extensin-like [Iris pallida]|uniref:Extensin-like n=1 Tax=Iris pallida TaxID=29817 RepID=A0AAX6FSX4_IRIPA|nr:extensin-like [Iris pallida]
MLLLSVCSQPHPLLIFPHVYSQPPPLLLLLLLPVGRGRAVPTTSTCHGFSIGSSLAHTLIFPKSYLNRVLDDGARRCSHDTYEPPEGGRPPTSPRRHAVHLQRPSRAVVLALLPRFPYFFEASKNTQMGGDIKWQVSKNGHLLTTCNVYPNATTLSSSEELRQKA